MELHFSLGMFLISFGLLVMSFGLFMLAVVLLPVLVVIGALAAWKLITSSRNLGNSFWRIPMWHDAPHREPTTRSVEPQCVSPLSLLWELGWFGVPIVVAITFAGIATQGQLINRMILQRTDVTPNASAKSSPSSITVDQRVNQEQRTPQDKTANRPDWVSTSRTTDGLRDLVVLSSGQFTTAAEAEAELLSKASDLIHQELQQVNSIGYGAENWRPSDSDVKRFAVKKQYVEVTETDFVSFQHPMYRVWWQVELSPSVRAEFLPEWRTRAVSTRIWWVGIVASSFVLAASMIRVYCRMDSLTHGKYRLALNALNGTVAAAWAVLIRSVSEGRLW